MKVVYIYVIAVTMVRLRTFDIKIDSVIRLEMISFASHVVTFVHAYTYT